MPALVHALRKQRMGMVQTSEQYMYCYHVLVDEMVAMVGHLRADQELLQGRMALEQEGRIAADAGE